MFASSDRLAGDILPYGGIIVNNKVVSNRLKSINNRGFDESKVVYVIRVNDAEYLDARPEACVDKGQFATKLIF